MFKKIVIGLAAFLLSVLLVGFVLPSDFRVERVVSIAAPSEVIHRYVEDLPTWADWSAWNTENDPTLVYEYEGGARGVGAVMRWTGEGVGNGVLKITESDPESGIRYDLELQDGAFAARGQIRYGAEEQGTQVTWSDEGDLGWNPAYHWLGLMMDGMIGPELEQGLAALRVKAEADHAQERAPSAQQGAMASPGESDVDVLKTSLSEDDSAQGASAP